MLTVSYMSITHSGSLCPPPFSVSFSLLSSPTLPTNPLLKSLSFVLWSTEFKQGCLCRLELGTVQWSLLSLPMTTQLKKRLPFSRDPLKEPKRQKIWKGALECCLMDMMPSLQSWIHSNWGCLRWLSTRLGLSIAIHGLEKGSQGPLAPPPLLNFSTLMPVSAL